MVMSDCAIASLDPRIEYISTEMDTPATTIRALRVNMPRAIKIGDIAFWIKPMM
jgi:hypothetical protein